MIKCWAASRHLTHWLWSLLIAGHWHASCTNSLVGEQCGVSARLAGFLSDPTLHQHRGLCIAASCCVSLQLSRKQQILTWVASCDGASALWDSIDGFAEKMWAEILFFFAHLSSCPCQTDLEVLICFPLICLYVLDSSCFLNKVKRKVFVFLFFFLLNGLAFSQET